MTLNTSALRVTLAASVTDGSGFEETRWNPLFDVFKQLGAGTGADQADRIFADERTLAASASEELDLAGGLTDRFGVSLTFAEIVAVLVIAAIGNTNHVVVGGAASNAVPLFVDATDKMAVKPGGMMVVAGFGAAGHCTVTAGTGDLLKIANSGGTTGVTYQIVILGRSA